MAQAHYAIDGAFLHRLGPELISAYEQASVAWHELLGLASYGTGSRTRRRRQASQQIGPDHKRGPRATAPGPATDGASQVVRGLEAIYGPGSRAKSHDQAEALGFIHQTPRPATSVIVLATGSGKSVLFLSMAAMAVDQTVTVVVPFAALVDNIIVRGRAAGLTCGEWRDSGSYGGELRQLTVVSADRAAQEGFLHYAQGLALHGELAHIFFDECHVAITDTSYRTRLRALWKLRYIDCPFTGLTGTLMVDLEWKLREQLLIEQAVVFRRSTVRRTIRYQVMDSGKQSASEVGITFIQQLPVFGAGQRGVVYVRSYGTGDVVSSALECPFYKAHADHKSEVLEQWATGPGGWIVATGALGTGIDISGVSYVVHIDRPYGLTSFAQQSGRGGRGGEVSESIIIVRMAQGGPPRRAGPTPQAYTVEQVDEEAMTAYMATRGCRRRVLGRYFDGAETDCGGVDGVLCDNCQREARVGMIERVSEQVGEQVVREEAGIVATDEPSGLSAIQQRLHQMEASYEGIFRFMDQLGQGCIYCQLIHGKRPGEHGYWECAAAGTAGCDQRSYEAWRGRLTFPSGQQCWNCGLPQGQCHGQGRADERGKCAYRDVIFQGIFILHKSGNIEAMIRMAGFPGQVESGVELWGWMNQEVEGFGVVRESNWVGTWRVIYQVFVRMGQDRGVGVGSGQ